MWRCWLLLVVTTVGIFSHGSVHSLEALLCAQDAPAALPTSQTGEVSDVKEDSSKQKPKENVPVVLKQRPGGREDLRQGHGGR